MVIPFTFARLLLAMLPALTRAEPVLDRPSIVRRHNPTLVSINSSEVLVLGNGAFAMAVDVTGLQTLNDTAFSGKPRLPHEPDYCCCPAHSDVRYVYMLHACLR